MKKKFLAVALSFALAVTAFSFTPVVQAVNTDKTESSSGTLSSPSDFSWDNASVYFLLTDRFLNGKTSNDHSYKRSLNQSGQVVKGNSDSAAFHGGDFEGITKKIEEGYFDDLGVNALWISAPYEQIHGYCIAGTGKSGSFPHYSYHGYYALDFSQPDANFGDEKEFQKLVDTAHSHGIRIVMDIVMNHVGYNTIEDMNTYGFGTLKNGWQDGYYNATLNDSSYHNYIDYNSDSNAWAKWWGSDWLRAGLAGYREGSGDLQGSLSFLPDVKTESTQTVDIPAVLKTKWTKENTLSQKSAELNNYFKNNNKSKTVRNYLVFWLTQWVEKYGIDGFRCDTAKHVELESWKALKEQGVKSLKTWRANNPSKPGANWDEDFWMTGECFPHYLSYDSFYTSGGFDSMINFSFNSESKAFDANGQGVPGSGSINNTYSDYAKQLNTNDKYNVLTYLSSHDTSLCRKDMIYQGSAFQLLPGAIQIYYGDESNRPLEGGLASGKDHNLRSDMNWNNMDKNLLTHWQKVGKFRSNHVSVGAGSHTNLSATSGAAFTRSYSKNGVSDKVVACIGANKSANVTITLNNTFPDGTELRNAYDGTTAVVSGGKVTFNSGANGTILLETTDKQIDTQTPTSTTATTASTATQNTTPSQGTSSTDIATPPVNPDGLYGDANCDGTINVADVTVIQKKVALISSLSDLGNILADVDGDGIIKIKDATCIQKHIAKMANTSSVGKPYYKQQPTTQTSTQTTPSEQPTQETTEFVTTPSEVESGTVVYFENTENWATPYIYYWTGSSGPLPWPGVPMEQTSDGRWTFTIPEGYDKCIFNDNGGTQTGDLTPPSSGMTYNYSNQSWS